MIQCTLVCIAQLVNEQVPNASSDLLFVAQLCYQAEYVIVNNSNGFARVRDRKGFPFLRLFSKNN